MKECGYFLFISRIIFIKIVWNDNENLGRNVDIRIRI